MNLVTSVHIVAGSAAILAGTVAVAARKGGPLHARAGAWFVDSMIVLGVTATVLALLEGESGLGGILTCYFVLTSWVTARRRDGSTGKFEMAACALALGLAAVQAWGAATGAATTPVGAGPIFALATVCVLAGFGDLAAVLRKQLTPLQRISRHLWRMCVAFFIATGSFFLGQQDVMPLAVRGSPMLLALGFAPLAVMLFWLVRLRLGKWLRGGLPAAAPAAR
jgi:hypothetical protein